MSVLDTIKAISNNNSVISANNETIAQNMEQVYYAGYGNGYSNGEHEGYDRGVEYGKTVGEETGYSKGFGYGYDQGLSEGRVAERDAFWENLQENGNRRLYSFAFSYFTDDIFYPKYDIICGKPTGYGTVTQAPFAFCKVTNLKERLEECGVKLVLQTISFSSFFLGCQSTELPLLDFTDTGITSIAMQSTFNSCKTKNIDIKNVIITSIQSPFNGCSNLEDITLEGCTLCGAGASGFVFTTCTKLTKTSILNVFYALEDLTAEGATATNKTITLGATHLAKLTDEEKAIATGKGWTLA